MIDPEWKGFRRAPDGTLCWDGWAVFGHILPRIGFLPHPRNWHGELAGEAGDVEHPGFEVEVLCLEWLGRGFAIRMPWAEPRQVSF